MDVNYFKIDSKNSFIAKHRSIFSFIKMSIICLLLIIQYSFAVTHPHLIVAETEYAQLQARSVEYPWSEMKNKAIRDAKSLAFDANASYSSICTRAHDIAGACALAYILDPDSRSTFREGVKTQLAPAIQYIRTEKGTKTEHAYNVGPAHAAFMTYLALDIMYNDLSPDIRQAMEENCDYIAANHVHSWKSSEYSIKGMMELYHNGNTPLFESIKNDYKDHILSLTSEDGVFTTGPGYTKSRVFMDNRMQKKAFMDICEYQGYTEFYNHPVLLNLYEWVLGYSVTPFNRTYTFGDSPPTKDLDHWAVSALRASRFSEIAQKYASWQLGPLTEDKIKGQLLHYLLCDSLPVSAKRPQSRIFHNGGAWLLEDSDSDKALAGALWNINTVENSHNHFDVNAIHIAAYGEHVVRNSGYDGYGAPDPVTWEWIRRTAESSNTLLLDNKNHTTWRGGGITEAIVGEDVEYASGFSGTTLPIAQHQRNFVFVKPQQNTNNGYFVVFDEVNAGFIWGPSTPVNVVWHPNSDSDPITPVNNMQYEWNIGGCNYSHHPVGVTFFLCTPPSDVSIRTGYKASYSECSRYLGTYLFTTYPLDQNKTARIATVIFPHDDSHPKADMMPISGLNVSGAIVHHGNAIRDVAICTHADTLVGFDNVSFQGSAAVYREKNQKNQFYFVRKARSFNDGSQVRKGFEADSTISLFIKDKDGQISSPGTLVTFYYPELTGVNINDGFALINDSGPGWVQVQVDSGLHRIHLISTYTTVLERPNVIKAFRLMQNYPNPFNPTTTIRYSLSESRFVTLRIFNLNGQHITTLVRDHRGAGEYSVQWTARKYPSGIYFCQLQAGDNVANIKILLQK